LLACASLFAFGCGESSSGSNGSDDAGRGGSSGSATTGGTGGASATGGTGGASATGGSAGASMELEPYFEPGTRLKPLVVVAAPGLDIIERPVDSGWHDSELDFDCYFALDEAGVERCFPASILSGLVYADASCTRPVVTLNGTGPCDRLRYQYVVDNVALSDGCGAHGYHVGDELPATTPLFYSLDGVCQASSGSSTPGHVYELEAVPPETFVGMHRVGRPRAPGLDAHVREGDDGSWQVVAFFDPTRETPCLDLGIDMSPPSKCLPPYAAAGGYFADAACEVRISEVRPASCIFEPPTTIIDLRYDSDACPPVQPFDLYEIDASRETIPYSLDTSGACVATDTEPKESYVQGAPIDLATIPTLETLVVGSGRVQGRFSGFGGVPFLPDVRRGAFVDAESGVACMPYQISDGTLRCIPRSFGLVGPEDFFYESSSCSGARVVLWQPNPPCLTDAPLPEGVFLTGDATDCGREPIVTEVNAIAGPSTAGTLYFANSMTGACEPVADLSPSVTPLSLGEPLDPAEIFAPVERTIRE
jgi:hypothetical protein